jgi:hypothetical protein
MCICVGVVHLQFLFTQILYVKAFECLVIDLSFLYVVFPLSPRLYYMCVLCEVYVGHILRFVCLFLSLDMFLISGFKCASHLSDIP